MTDTTTLTLSDFLLARIAEDEAAARHSIDGDIDHLPSITTRSGDVVYLGVTDPARVLAECEAKRRIVELHAPHYAARGLLFCFTCRAKDNSGGWHPAPCATLLALAAVYAGHPDYRDEWRP